ncbi:MAG: RNA methyltransferase [Clostridia bacterium]|nr:RNA methyltransferase [Clostridia bacterium]
MNVIRLKNGAELRYISSRSNAEVVSASKLTMKKYREEQGLFLCEGEKLFEEAVLYGDPYAVFVSEDSVDRLSDKTAGYLSDPRFSDRVFLLSRPAFEKITTERSPQGVIASVRIPERRGVRDAVSGLRSGESAIILDGVRDPGNVGGILRTAAAFGFGSAVLIDCADPFGDRAVRASMGAVFRIRITETESAVEAAEQLASSGRRLVAAALTDDSETLGSFEPSDDDVVVIGNEGHGISKKMLSVCSVTLKIPMAEGCESLNAGSAAAVILWEYRKNRR